MEEPKMMKVDFIALLVIAIILSIGSLLTSCMTPDVSWDSRVIAYEVHHEIREGKYNGESKHDILRRKGVEEKEIPATIKLLDRIKHEGE